VFDHRRKVSYTDQRKWRSGLLRFVGAIVLLFATINIVTICLIATVAVENDTMSPVLRPGDRLIVASSSYGLRLPSIGFLFRRQAPERGDLVLVERSPPVSAGWQLRLADAVVRFCTIQQRGILDRRYALKRVIGLPGDEVSINGFVARIKQADEAYALTEFELSPESYDIAQDSLPEGWLDDMPLSAFMEERLVGEDEYFVLSDNRPLQSDSRTWGAVKTERIIAKAFFRYWPLSRFGTL
jgi:signal peptidase I